MKAILIIGEHRFSTLMPPGSDTLKVKNALLLNNRTLSLQYPGQVFFKTAKDGK